MPMSSKDMPKDTLNVPEQKNESLFSHYPRLSAVSGAQSEDTSSMTSMASAMESLMINKEPEPKIFEELSANVKIGLDSLPHQYELGAKKRGCKFNIMLAGGVGLGKTTFLNTLFESELLPLNNDVPKESARVIIDDFSLEESNYELKLSVVRSAGFDQLTDNRRAWAALAGVIEDSSQRYMLQSEQPDRKNLEDYRTHVCIYFLAPSGGRLRALDLESMKELSKVCNLIPVIAKSDSLSKIDLLAFKDSVRLELFANEITICEALADESVSSKIASMAPYSIIGSSGRYLNRSGKLVRGRKYEWGVAEVENTEHCDFIHLRDLLLRDHTSELIATTEDYYYENFRSKALNQRLTLAQPSNKPVNGTEQLKLYHSISIKNTPSDLIYPSPEFDKRGAKIKKELAEVVLNQEKLFREWRQRLIEKQSYYNDDIQKCHSQMVSLQVEIAEIQRNLNTSSSTAMLLPVNY